MLDKIRSTRFFLLFVVKDMPSETMIYLSDNKAILNDQDSYSYVLSQPITNAKSISLESASIYWTWQNISKFNNVLHFRESDQKVGDADKVLTLTCGTYSCMDLTTALTVGMTAVGTQTYTATYSDITHCLSFTGTSKEFTLKLVGSTMKSLIGLTADTTSSSYITTLSQAIDLLPVKEIQIHLSSLTNCFENTTSSTSDLVAMIPLSGFTDGDCITTQYSSVELPLQKQNISNITLDITDQDGFSIYFDETKRAFSLLFRIELY